MAIKKISLNELRSIVKKMIKEEVNPITGLEGGLGIYNKMEVTDSDIMLAKRLEKYVDTAVLSVNIKPTFGVGNIDKPKPSDKFDGPKSLWFTLNLGDSVSYGDIKETINRVNKFFSTKPNNYEILSGNVWAFKIKSENNDITIGFEARDLYSTKEKPKLRKDMMNTQMGKKRKEGGF